MIPESISLIAPGAFEECTSLNSLVVEKTNPIYDSRYNCNAIIETKTNKLIVGCDTTIIPNGVTEIYETAFRRCTSLTNITIPEGVLRIGLGAFYGCTSLEKLDIPKTVTTIKSSAFRGCTSLKSITIPKNAIWISDRLFEGSDSLRSIVVEEGNPQYDSRNNCNAIIDTEYNELIMGCAATIIPEGVKKIREKAFANCSSLTNIVIPKGVKNIESHAFEKCLNLQSITLPIGVRKIGEFAFCYCKSLQTIYVPAKKTDYYKQRLSTYLHSKIVELKPVKK